MKSNKALNHSAWHKTQLCCYFVPPVLNKSVFSFSFKLEEQSSVRKNTAWMVVAKAEMRLLEDRKFKFTHRAAERHLLDQDSFMLLLLRNQKGTLGRRPLRTCPWQFPPICKACWLCSGAMPFTLQLLSTYQFLSPKVQWSSHKLSPGICPS